MSAHAPKSALLAVPFLVVVADQVSKLWVLDHMALYQSIAVIPGLFSITSVRNPGAAFGLFSQYSVGFRTGFLVGVSLLAVLMLTVFYLKSAVHERTARSAALLVIGGALGNLIDRIRFGEVVDFLDVFIGSHHWPAFNIADAAITIGITLFIWSSWRDREVPDQASANRPVSQTDNEERS